MNSYDRVMAVLDGKKKEVDRLPCINSVGTYTKDFMEVYDAYWPASHKDPEKMAKLASAAHRLCGLDNITVPFDLIVEAEVLGAPVDFFEGKVKWPSIKNFTVKDYSDLKFPEDVSNAGRIPVITKAIKILKEEFEGKVPITAYINAPFTSVSSYLVETSSFLIWVKRNPEKVHEFYRGMLPTYSNIGKIYKEAGADIITFREEGTSTDNLAPIQFDQFVKPYLSDLIGRVKPPRILHMCGSTLLIIDRLIKCNANAITIDERAPVKKAKEIIESLIPGYPIGGNINSYSVIAKGPIEKIKNAVKNVIEDGVDMVAPGCDIYLDTPTEFVKAFVDATIEYGTIKGV